MKNKKAVLLIILLISSTNFIIIKEQKIVCREPFFTLVYKTMNNHWVINYGQFLKLNLGRIGIDLDVIILDDLDFYDEVYIERDFDITYQELFKPDYDPDWMEIYSENGSLNLSNYNSSIDYYEELETGLNEWFIQQCNLIIPSDSEERMQCSWDWQQYLMDKIVPIVTLFNCKDYSLYWSNLFGYNISKGLFQSWGHMNWDGLHENQINDNELYIANGEWNNLIPIFNCNENSSLIQKACLDPLFWLDNEKREFMRGFLDKNFRFHLLENYTYLDNTTLQLKIREGIKWQTDSEGIFTDEYLDIHDVFFTIYMWNNYQDYPEAFPWISNMEIIDDYTMNIYIDGDESTLEHEIFAPALAKLNILILPEHYLNQSQLADMVSPDINHPSWEKYSNRCFGTGLFEINDITSNEISMNLFSDCWWLNESITSDTLLDWENRFGNFTGGLDKLRIKMIGDINSTLSEFLIGQLDFITVQDYNLISEIIDNGNFQSQNLTNGKINYFVFNLQPNRSYLGDMTPTDLDPTMTKGVALRKAISYAIGKTEINAINHYSDFSRLDHPIPSNLGEWCNPNIIRYNYDLDKAREYMTRAGYDIGWVNGCNVFPASLVALIVLLPIISLLVISFTIYLIVKMKKRKRVN